MDPKTIKKTRSNVECTLVLILLGLQRQFQRPGSKRNLLGVWRLFLFVRWRCFWVRPLFFRGRPPWSLGTVVWDTTVHTTPGQGTMEILTFVGFAGNLSVFSHGQGVKVLDCTLAILGCWAVSGTVNSNPRFFPDPKVEILGPK